MSLQLGTRLGPYEITGALGAGSMGEVYRARDTRLGRTVAIKVLPPDLAADPERRQRFEREAKTVSQLNHPHICALFDVGEAELPSPESPVPIDSAQGRSGPVRVRFLVMEHLVGETLAERLRRGAVPLEQALTLAAQVAGALSAAHRHGVTHRDLKPANVMLTKGGAKLLDFGLAKLRGQGDQPAAGTLVSVPTRSEPLTGQGMILGTLQYMAPEQLEGKPADARTDLFAFGAIVYEMVTGCRTFEGTSRASLISAILRDEPPPLAALQPAVPPALDRLVRACLAKDPDERWQSTGDLCRELRWIAESQVGGATPGIAGNGRSGFTGVAASAAAEQTARRLARRLTRWALPFVAGAVLVSVVIWVLSRRAAEPPAFREWKATFDGSADWPALSPDGEKLAYQVTRCFDGVTCWAELEWQDLKVGGPLRIAPTVDRGGQAVRPMWFWQLEWSPDGQDVLGAASFEDERLNGLYLIPSLGGTPTRLAEGTITSVAYRPGTGIVDWIRFPEGLQGRVRPIWQSLDLATQQIEDHDLPFAATDIRWAPDGRWLALSRGVGNWLASGESNVAIASRTGEIHDTHVIPGAPGWSRARWNAEGTLLYLASRGRLVAIDVDQETGLFSGEPRELVDTRQPPGWFDFVFDVSAGGLGAYSRYDLRTTLRLVTATETQGIDLDRSTGFKGDPGLSWDGRDVAYVKQDLLGINVYVQSIAGGNPRRVTRTGSFKRHPAWSPDGQLLAFVDSGDAGSTLMVVGRNGERPRPIGRLSGLSSAQPFGWSSDGRFLIFVAGGVVWRSEIDGRKEKLLDLPQPITNAWGLAISPNGHTIALLSHYYPGGKDNFFQIHLADMNDLAAGWTIRFQTDWNEWLTDGVETRRSPFDGWTQLTLQPWRSPDALDVGYSRVAGTREVSGIWRVALNRGTADRLADLSDRCSGGIAGLTATQDLSRIVCPLIDASRDIWVVDGLDGRIPQ